MNHSLFNFSVVIPVFIDCDEKYFELHRCLESIASQDLLPNRVLLSTDTPRWNLNHLEIEYSEINLKILENKNKPGIASNSNNALDSVDSDFIHILHQDDFILDKKLYSKASTKLLDKSTNWLIITNHEEENLTVEEFLTRQSLLGFNNLGGPSAVIMKANSVRFSEKYSMLVDVTYFADLRMELGEPAIVSGKCIGYGDSANRVSRIITSAEIRREIETAAQEYNFNSDEIMGILMDRKLDCFHRFLVLTASEKILNLSLVDRLQVKTKLQKEILVTKIRGKIRLIRLKRLLEIYN